ncbi:hypothetical protein [Colwellia sp. E2M01]|uniref:hypothetical protein n=1 Tax=Colwellia sp. E2M01 TaxID=2841561 RepID=UPI001C090C1C|nr:hypothetical protein [Colwellia sp. E2M01]MBU2870426.1 hypothetical protein [Colwellia sp. E2M01]
MNNLIHSSFKHYCMTLALIALIATPVITKAKEQQVDIVTYPWIEGGFKVDDYYIALLKLVLENSKDKFGEYELIKAEFPMFQNRVVSEIKQNRGLVNILWTKTSIQREQVLAPIRYPLLRGLGAYRIALIHKDNKLKFSSLTSEKSLRHLLAGQGVSWPDSLILQDNNYSLLEVPGHESLFKMLSSKRFDYMPRALNEAWDEAEMFPNLIVDTNFAIHYPAPYYFFVNINNNRLIERLEYGFRISEENGSFKALFDTHESTREALLRADLPNRKIFWLTNNFLSPETKKVMEQHKGDFTK